MLPSTPVWERLYKEGKLQSRHRHISATKPAEELYDLKDDRYEARNLASSEAHEKILNVSARPPRDELQVKDVGSLLRSGNDAEQKASRRTRSKPDDPNKPPPSGYWPPRMWEAPASLR